MISKPLIEIHHWGAIFNLPKQRFFYMLLGKFEEHFSLNSQITYPLKRRFISSAGRVPIKDIDFVTQFFNGLIIMGGR